MLPKETTVLANGAILVPISEDCTVCKGRGEETEVAEYRLQHQGQDIFLCRAHTMMLLDINDDEKRKGGVDQFLGKK